VEAERIKSTQQVSYRKNLGITYAVLAIFLISAVWMVHGQLFGTARNVALKPGPQKDSVKVLPPTPPDNAVSNAATPQTTTNTQPLARPDVTERKTQTIPNITSNAPASKPAASASILNTSMSQDTVGYAIGASKNVVLTMQGTPTSITRYNDGSELWSYGKSTVFFENNKLKSYNDIDNNLLLKK
jgi:hypothetical protein